MNNHNKHTHRKSKQWLNNTSKTENIAAAAGAGARASLRAPAPQAGQVHAVPRPSRSIIDININNSRVVITIIIINSIIGIIIIVIIIISSSSSTTTTIIIALQRHKLDKFTQCPALSASPSTQGEPLVYFLYTAGVLQKWRRTWQIELAVLNKWCRRKHMRQY